MSLPYVILTILEQQDASGYDLQKIISTQLSDFWQASHQQIYRDLTKMAQKDWVQFDLIEQQGKPNLKKYQITPQGTQALHLWQQTPKRAHPLKDEFLIKLLSPIQNKDALITEAQSQLQQLETKIAQLNAQLSQLTKLAENENEITQGFHLPAWQQQLAIQRHLLDAQSHQTWLKQTLEQLTIL